MIGHVEHNLLQIGHKRPHCQIQIWDHTVLFILLLTHFQTKKTNMQPNFLFFTHHTHMFMNQTLNCCIHINYGEMLSF